MSRDPLLCPSAAADAPDAVVVGVVLGSADEPRLHPLEHPVPVDDAILASTAPLPPTQVLRLAAACRQDRCRHFANGDRACWQGVPCRRAVRLVEHWLLVSG